MLINIGRNNPLSRSGIKFGFDNNISKQQGHKKSYHQRLGPFLFVKQINVVFFQLKLPNSMKIHLVFHVYLLEPYYASTILGRIHDPPSLIKVDGEQNTKWKTCWIQGSLMINSNIFFISMGVM